MGLVCVSCGAPWESRHVCVEQLVDVGLMTRDRRGRAHVVDDQAQRDKSPTFTELDHRMRSRSWRPR